MNPNQTPAPVPPETSDPNAAPTPPASTPEVTPPAATPAPENVTPEPAPLTPPAPEATPNPFATPTSPIGSAPAGPIGSSPSSEPVQMPSSGGSGKKLAILLSAIGGGILLLAGIGIAVFFIFFYVSKADYKAAVDQLNVVSEKTNENPTSGALSSDSADQIDAVQTAYDEFKAEHAKLAGLKALRVDSELHEKYVAYEKKANEYIAFMDAFIPSLEKFLAVADVAKDSGSNFNSANVQKMIDALEAAKDVQDPSIKTFVVAALDAYKQILPELKKYESASSSSEKLAALNKISTISRSLSGASTTLSDDIEKRYEEVSPKDTFDALSELATKKYNAL